MKTIYRTTGRTSFDPEQFVKISNRDMWNKPTGGLWSSPRDSENSWVRWMTGEDWFPHDPDEWFDFHIKDDAKIMEIKSVKDVDKLPKIKGARVDLATIVYIDFEKMVEDGYQGMFVSLTDDWGLYMKLYGWDCDTLLVFDPSIMEVVECSGK